MVTEVKIKHKASSFLKLVFKLKILLIFCVVQNVYGQNVIEKKDQFTSELMVFEETKTFADGTAMSGEKVDGVIYLTENGTYYRRKVNGYVNVKWFGAKGDGDRNDMGTEDTQAIEKAIKTLGRIYKGYDLSGGNLFGGATLYFPGGKYLVNKTFVLPNNIIIKGESPTATVIHAKKPGFIFTNIGGFYPNGYDVIMNQNITIRDITLKQGGIEFQGAVSSRIEKVRIMNLSGQGTDTGISVKLSVDLRVKDVKIFSSTGYGILFQENVGGRASTTTSFEDVWVAHCKVGMLVDGSEGTMGIVSSNVTDSIFEYNQTGIKIQGRVFNFALRDIHFEQNSVNALDIDGDVNLILENIWGDAVGSMQISHNQKKIADNKIYLRNFNIPYNVNRNFTGKVIAE